MEYGELTIEALRVTTVAMVAAEGPDLSARQLAVLLHCSLEKEPQTVRGLAAVLNVSKPAVTRALDRLGELGFTKRETDPKDKRSVNVAMTREGTGFVAKLNFILATASAKAASATIAKKAGKPAKAASRRAA